MINGELDLKVPQHRVAIQLENCLFRERKINKFVKFFIEKLKLKKYFLNYFYPFDEKCRDILNEWSRLNIKVGLISFQNESLKVKYDKILTGIFYDDLLFIEDMYGLSSLLQREGYNYYLDTDLNMLQVAKVTAIKFTGWERNYII
jgi:hypothetical protein